MTASSVPGPPAVDGRRRRTMRTRARVVQAAYEVFCERGYAVPLTDIATRADISVQALYVTFGTKIELLRQVLQLAVHGDDDPAPPHARAWFALMSDEPDPERAILVLLQGTQGIYDRLSPLAGVLATSDPEIAALWEHSERLRYEGLSVAVDVLITKGPTRVSARQARDTAFVLLGPDVYRQFVAVRGWSPSRWRRWTAQTLTAMWFEPSAAPDT